MTTPLTGTEKDVLSGFTEEDRRHFRKLFYGVTEEELRRIIENVMKEWEDHIRSLAGNHTDFAKEYISLYGTYLFAASKIVVLERRLKAKKADERIDEALVTHTFTKSALEGLLERLSLKPEDLKS